MTYDMAAAALAVASADAPMAAHVDRAGPVVLRPPLDGDFAALVRSICYQQLAGKAAAAIHGRVVERLANDVSPGAVLGTPEADLRACGLSAAKLASIRDLAAKVEDGTVPLDGIQSLDDEEIIDRLSQVRGIGRWTAEMFLLFQLRRPDIWPVGDLGVRMGYSLVYGLATPPTPKELALEGERFRPYRSVAAWYCWEAVHMSRAQPGEPAAGRAAAREAR